MTELHRVSSASALPAAGHIGVDGIDHVNISVRDLERSVEFYSRVFGFRVVEEGRSSNRRFVIMSAAAQAFLAIHEFASAARPKAPFLNHWGFVVGDLDRVRRQALALGVAIADVDEESLGIHRWPKSRSMYVLDPDGHEIELVEVWGGGLGA